MSEEEEIDNLSKLPIGELAQLFYNHLCDPKPDDKIAAWNTEASHINEMTEFLKMTDAPQNVAIAAVSYLLRYVPGMLDTLDPEGRLQYTEVLFSLFSEQANRFSNGCICVNFCELFATTIISLFGEIPKINEMIDSFFEIEIADTDKYVICLTLFAQICIIARKKSIFHFFSQYGTHIIEYCIPGMEACIASPSSVSEFLAGKLANLILEEMTFELQNQETQQRNSTASFTFSEATARIVTNQEFIATVFNLLKICGENGPAYCDIYKILYFMSSLDERNFQYMQAESEGADGEEDAVKNMSNKIRRGEIRREYLLYFFSTFLEYFKECNLLPTTLEALTHLVEKIKATMDSNFNVSNYDFQGLCESVSRLNETVFNAEYFLGQIGTTQNIIHFWETCNREKDEQKGEIFTLFIEIVTGGLMNDPEYRDAFLETKQTSIYEDLKDLARGNFLPVSQTLSSKLESGMAEFYSKAEKEAPAGESAVLAFLIDFTIAISPNDLRIEEEAVEKLAQLYRQIFDIFANVFAMEPIEGLYIQKSLISLAREVTKMPVLTTSMSLFFEKIKEIPGVADSQISSPDDIFSFIIFNLIDFFDGRYPEALIQEAAQALHHLFKQKNTLRVAFKKGCAEKLITDLEQCKINIEIGLGRKMLHTAVADILKTKIESDLDSVAFIQSQYDKAFEGHSKAVIKELFEAMVDFSGYFADLDNTACFFLFFDYLFPEKLEHFTSIIPQLVNEPQIINSLLDFWVSMLSNKSIIVFRNHSPNGLKLFKIGQAFVRTIMENLSERVKESGENENSNDFMVKMAQIFDLLLGASYVPYNAFIVFEDPALMNFINDFFALIQMYELDHEMANPELSEALIGAIISICKNHLSIIINAGHGNLLIACIGSYLLSASNPTRACTALEYLLDNIEDITALSHDDFARLVFVIWGHIYRKSSNTQLHNIVYKMYSVYSGSMELLHERIMEYAVDKAALDEKFTEYMSEIESPDKTAFSNATTKFANNIRTLIRAPHIAFS